MAKRERVNEIVKDMDGKKIAEFTSKTLTSVFNKKPQGTTVKIFIDEGKDFGEQFVGHYVIKGLPNQPPDPHTCPDGQHWDGTKCVDNITPPPVHECPAGQHWDEATQSCVPDVVIPPGAAGSWNSNTDGKWNDGNKRTITIKQPSTFKDDGSIFVAASGSPKLEIDGDGTAHLIGGTGGVDNLSLKLRSRHQSGGACENRAGGEGFAVDRKAWDAKRETCHNIHDSQGSGSLSQTLKDETWYKVRFTVKDEGGKIRIIGELDYGNGFVKECDLLDSNAEAWFFDQAKFAAESWFWIRINNSAHPRIYVCRANYNSVLTLDFKFEPSKNSVGLRNVQLTPI